MPQLNEKIDVIITDPPYPDYYVYEYKYYEGILNFLEAFDCRQLIFWSADCEFPLDYTARHIWNKNPSNKGAQYEFIYERNGGKSVKKEIVEKWNALDKQRNIEIDKANSKFYQEIGLLKDELRKKSVTVR